MISVVSRSPILSTFSYSSCTILTGLVANEFAKVFNINILFVALVIICQKNVKSIAAEF